MAKTYNRTPTFVKEYNYNNVGYKYFNYTSWKGMCDDKNYIGVDQETFEDCKNVYVDENGVLRSRPSVKLASPHGITNVVKVWNFDIVQAYKTQENEGYGLTFVKDGKVAEVNLPLPEDFTLVLADEKVFMFAENRIAYWDIREERWYDTYSEDEENRKKALDKIYVPITETNISSADTDVEQPNELTTEKIKTYIYNSPFDIKLPEFIGKDVKIKIGDLEYNLKFNINTPLVLVDASYKFDSDDVYCKTMLGENGEGLPYIEFAHSESSPSVKSGILSYCTEDENYATYTIYYTTDYITFQYLDTVSEVIHKPLLSENCAYVIVFKDDGPYVKSILSDTEDGTKRFSKWTNLLLYSGYEETISMNNGGTSGKNVVVGGKFVDYQRYSFAYAHGKKVTMISCESGSVKKYDVPLYPYLSYEDDIRLSGTAELTQLNTVNSSNNYNSGKVFLDRFITKSEVLSNGLKIVISGKDSYAKNYRDTDDQSMYELFISYYIDIYIDNVKVGRCVHGVRRQRYYNTNTTNIVEENDDQTILLDLHNVSEHGKSLLSTKSKFHIITTVQYDTLNSVNNIGKISEIRIQIQPEIDTSDTNIENTALNVYISDTSRIISIATKNSYGNSERIYSFNSNVVRLLSTLYTGTKPRCPLRNSFSDDPYKLYYTYADNTDEYKRTSINKLLFSNSDLTYDIVPEELDLTKSSNEVFKTYSSTYILTSTQLHIEDKTIDLLKGKNNIPLLVQPKIVAYVGKEGIESTIYSNITIDKLDVYVTTKGELTIPKFDFTTKLSNFYFTTGNKVMISSVGSNQEIGEFRWYFPKINTETFDYEITAIHPISTTEIAIFFEHAIYYVASTEAGYAYYKSRIPLGCKKGSSAVTSYDGKYTIFVTARGLVAMSYQDFVSATEQTLTYLSDLIVTKFSEWNKGPINIEQYKFWLIIYRTDNNEGFVYDMRNSSWWPMEIPAIPQQIYSEDDKLYVIQSNLVSKFDISQDEYYDDKGKIDWRIASQKLHFNAINYYKYILNVIFNAINDDYRETTFNLDTINYSRSVGSGEGKTVNYTVDLIGCFVRRLNYQKVNEFQFILSSDENAQQVPLSLTNISIKYKITGQVR